MQIGSAFLFGFYLVIKFIGVEWLNWLLSYSSSPALSAREKYANTAVSRRAKGTDYLYAVLRLRRQIDSGRKTMESI